MGFRLHLLTLILFPVVVWGKDYFTAAVFEHRPRAERSASHEETIAANLKFFERATEIAVTKGADIIVFNEYGIYPYLDDDDRGVLKKLAEHIPDPETTKFNPCVDGGKDMHILSTLSCMARKYNIYLVGNLGDVQSCEGTCSAQVSECDQKCPEDGMLIYNTDVAFDRKGHLIARYHKNHLYFENYNTPEKPEFVTFSTEFGKFGLFTCFDSVFEESMILARDYEIDTAIFPTFWFDDMLPFNAAEWQQSWAIANKVNFMAANIQIPGNASLGSGIYSKKYGALVYTYEPDGESKLLVANVPIVKHEEPSDVSFEPSITVVKEDATYLKTENGEAFPEQAYVKVSGPANDFLTDYRVYESLAENFTLIKLEANEGGIEACNNGFCCKLEYIAEDIAEEYYFGAFSGLDNVGGYFHWCEETCLLLRCDPLDGKPCAMQPSRSKTVFKSLKISADFTAERVYPTVTKSKFRLAPKREWNFERKCSKAILEFHAETEEPLMKAGLLGRCYKRDPPFIPWYQF